MSRGRFTRLLLELHAAVAGTIYGTIVVMATVAAGSRGEETDAWQLALAVAVTVLVLWFAHVYSHALAESIERRRRLHPAEFRAVARRELAIPVPALAPITVLVLAAVDILDEQTAVWIALGIGVATLGVQGARYAVIRAPWPNPDAGIGLLNVLLGLVIVALEES